MNEYNFIEGSRVYWPFLFVVVSNYSVRQAIHFLIFSINSLKFQFIHFQSKFFLSKLFVKPFFLFFIMSKVFLWLGLLLAKYYAFACCKQIFNWILYTQSVPSNDTIHTWRCHKKKNTIFIIIINRAKQKIIWYWNS